MEDFQNHLTIATALVAVLFGLLCTILGWIGHRISEQLDGVAKKLDDLSNELHTRINQIDQRLTRVETKCDFEHGKAK